MVLPFVTGFIDRSEVVEHAPFNSLHTMYSDKVSYFKGMQERWIDTERMDRRAELKWKGVQVSFESHEIHDEWDM